MTMAVLQKWDEAWFWGNVIWPLFVFNQEKLEPERETLEVGHEKQKTAKNEEQKLQEKQARSDSTVFERRHRRSMSEDMLLDLPRRFQGFRKTASSESTMQETNLNDAGASKGPKLDTISSGKEFVPDQECSQTNSRTRSEFQRASVSKFRRKRGSRSLSELEFGELKGFLDLGFTFNKDDLTPRLFEILPGLHQLDGLEDKVSRGASDTLFIRSESTNMKESLKLWAHAVASSVKTE